MVRESLVHDRFRRAGTICPRVALSVVCAGSVVGILALLSRFEPPNLLADSSPFSITVYLPVSVSAVAFDSLPAPTGIPVSTEATSSSTPAVPATPTPRSGEVNPISPPIPSPPDDVFANCAVRLEEDWNSDGLADSITSSEYNTFSEKLRELLDRNADAIPDAIRSWNYDANGRLESQASDDDADGLFDRHTLYSYDVLGRLIRIESGRESAEPDEVSDLTYDAVGDHPLIETRRRLIDGQLTVVAVLRYTYDESGHRIRIERSTQMDALPRWTLEYRWLGDLLVEATTDNDGDGQWDLSARYTYDVADRMTREDLDVYPDHLSDEWRLFDYDAHGWLVRTSHFRAGEMETDTVFRYDVDGRIVERLSETVAGRVTFRYVNSCP